MNATKIHYSRLSAMARATIQDYGLTVAEYVRKAGWDDGDWHGDRCGCTDDRCIGYHHDETDECGCLPVLIEDLLGWKHVPRHTSPNAPTGMPSYPDGSCLGSFRRTAAGNCYQCGWQG